MIDAREVIARLRLKRAGREWRGNCPACGYAGAFVLRTVPNSGRSLAWCASCQDREAIARAIGGGPTTPPPVDAASEEAARARKRERALGLWRGAIPAPGTPAAVYLARRELADLASSAALRFRGDTPHPAGGRLPALLALVTDGTGQPMAVHRTFLTSDGSKATVMPVKATLGPVWGGAIRLDPHDAAQPLVIGEGIETAASAGRLTGLPAWAAVSAGNLAKAAVLPPDTRRVMVAADPDPVGRNAARDAWLRWTAEGREVQIATPDGSGDFNDLLRSREVPDAA